MNEHDTRAHVWLATCFIRDYADPTEPTKYPEKYTRFAEVRPDDILISWKDLRKLIELRGRNMPYSNTNTKWICWADLCDSLPEGQSLPGDKK